ncbi:PREDICTED: pyridoxal phosphate phosphatase PHOSPHO2-like [Amphimedon queenslandica]|nr:PREDICTED: pyridoxal phosphate phosphatase PHOSPHO2-like [Amphimedon queenslandica]|eukprot:XP_011403524.1 PREDICTED: pyridoxal phosphate phosphatase PHOSPHO2-like [Amphimedon queenslandica]
MADSEGAEKVLFVFDFDHTLIDDNCDTYAMNVAPQLNLIEKVHEMRKEFTLWITMMNYVMKAQYEHGSKPEDVLRVMKEIDLIGPMKRTLEKIKEHPLVDAIIVSDANSFFIRAILENHNLADVFKTIHTNPACFNESGCLEISHYHAHCCTRCRKTPNMCKGLIMHSIAEERSTYSRIVYVGDGSNDYCAAMHLSPRDHVVARTGYGLAKRIAAEKPPPSFNVIDFTDPQAAVLLQSLMP